MFGAIRVRFISLWTKLRLLTSPLWWRTRGLVSIRTFFAKLFDVKPRDKKDYYGILGWLVSKRLAFALTVIVGILSIFYIFVLSPIAPRGDWFGGGGIPTYKYNSIPLRFAKGEVRIVARSGYVAYVGEVSKGQVKGQGKLFDHNGGIVYEGEFARNMYNGQGKFYYSTGELRYEGDFVDNLYHGNGKQYRLAGSLEYNGEFHRGEWNGQGMLYNPAATLIYSGTFQRGNILYSELIGKTTSEISIMYTGRQNVYSEADDYCVEMPEINAVYEVDGGQDALEADWSVKKVMVLEGSIWLGSHNLATISQLTDFFGAPDYFGETWVTLGEAAAINLIGDNIIGDVDMTMTAIFDNVFNVSDYDRDFSVYIFAYKLDGLLYTFYCTGSASQNFFMYAITSD
ncbi:MAG: hypothetical protein FWG83_01155 [Oscillospiraceae bacterium]|nr:hypothetical protein [Oscillospiraceae bacterium]